MGSPIAPILADVCMNWVLDQIPNNITQPSILIRYVDDLLCTFSDCNQLDNYFQSISNSQRWSRGHKARGQGQPFSRGQGHKRKCSSKERSSKIFFRRSPIHWRSQNFSIGGGLNHKLHKMTSSKFFQRGSFCWTKIS